MKKVMFNVKGMHCPSCEMLVSESLADLGAKNVKASWKDGKVAVEYDEKKVKESQLKDAIRKEGYKVI